MPFELSVGFKLAFALIVDSEEPEPLERWLERVQIILHKRPDLALKPAQL